MHDRQTGGLPCTDTTQVPVLCAYMRSGYVLCAECAPRARVRESATPAACCAALGLHPAPAAPRTWRVAPATPAIHGQLWRRRLLARGLDPPTGSLVQPSCASRRTSKANRALKPVPRCLARAGPPVSALAPLPRRERGSREAQRRYQRGIKEVERAPSPTPARGHGARRTVRRATSGEGVTGWCRACAGRAVPAQPVSGAPSRAHRLG